MLKRKRAAGQGDDPAPASALGPGTRAPDFTLPDQAGDPVSLGEFRGKPVVLVFYPASWSPVCGDQLTLYNEVLPMFEAHDARVLAISVDGRWTLRAFAEARNLRFPLLSDFEPKGAVARRYGVYDAGTGVARRALFVLDGEGTIRWSHVSPGNVNPGADGILHALEAL
ncbi:MAG: peroxiredoxin [Anaerolineae bacterium]|jgi:peroxiredoxin (alkyl hydroperoxide reductase subunit C)